MAINIGSEASCRKAYLNYHCYGNTMGIKPEEMGQITQAWEDRLESWQRTVSKDVNEYEFDDSDFEKYHDQGFDEAKETTGHNGKTGGMIARGTVDATAGVASAASGIVGNQLGKKAAEKVAEKVVVDGVVQEGVKGIGAEFIANAAKDAATEATTEAVAKEIAKGATEQAAKKAGEEAGKEAAKTAATEASKEVGKQLGFMVGCTVGAAIAATYFIKRPNKDGKEACDKLQNEMVGAQSALDQTQGDMQTAAGEITTLSDQANEVNETANLTIQNHKTEYDGYMQSINYLKDKAASGQQLSDSEKALYKELTAEVEESVTGIEDASTTVTDDVVEIYDDMATYQENYDMAAENMGQIEGLTDFAEGIDQTTQTMCYVESAAQGLNAASSGIAAGQAAAVAASGTWAFGATAWAWAFAALGAAGAAGSGVATAEQIKWAGEVGTEIDMRKATQDLNAATNDIYTEEIDTYAGMMQGVEDLEVDVPDELDVPDGSLPNQPAEAAAGSANQTPATGGLLFSTTTSKSEEEEKTNKVKKNEKEEKA